MRPAESADLLASYPRSRPPLPPKQAELYEREYEINRAGTGPLYRAVHALESWMHRKIADEHTTGAVLELGAGGLMHVPLERWCDTYDVVEPVTEIVTGSPNFRHVDRYWEWYGEYVDDACMGSLQYQKIFSVAVLEHLTDLPTVVAASAVALDPNGSFQAGIPMEGGALWELSWRCTTGIAYRLRTRASYAPLMHHEHINSAAEIVAVIGEFFADVKVSRFPLRGKHASMYAHVRAKQPRIGTAQSYLRGVGLHVAQQSHPDQALPGQ